MNHQDRYTVGEVASLTGVSVKTLHYYQKIGLLVPAEIGENNYRYYDTSSINRLHQILIYRNMSLPLHEIKSLLKTKQNESRLTILQRQLAFSLEKKKKLENIIQSLSIAIENERNPQNMKKDEFKDLDKDDSIYRTMQNITVLFNKPFTFMFWILSILMIVFYGWALITGSPLIYVPEGTRTEFVSITFIVIGIIVLGLTTHTLFFTKTKDFLDTINDKYKKKS